MVTKRIVCLANSRKHNPGRCIAGREMTSTSSGVWIRPVSARPTEEVSEHERQYEDGSDPKVLDIIDIPLIEAKPGTFQSENWLLDPDSYWVLKGQATLADLAKLKEDPPELWLNGFKTYSGLNDRVPEDLAQQLTRSLYLLKLAALTFNVYAPGTGFGNPKRRVQAVFTHHGINYALWVTDPVIEKQYLAKPNGSYSEGPCFATISLGEADKGFCYKLVAAIIWIN